MMRRCPGNIRGKTLKMTIFRLFVTQIWTKIGPFFSEGLLRRDALTLWRNPRLFSVWKFVEETWDSELIKEFRVSEILSKIKPVLRHVGPNSAFFAIYPTLLFFLIQTPPYSVLPSSQKIIVFLAERGLLGILKFWRTTVRSQQSLFSAQIRCLCLIFRFRLKNPAKFLRSTVDSFAEIDMGW